MKTDPDSGPVCAVCGNPMSRGAMAGLCPACLLARGLDTEPGRGHRRFEPPPVEALAKLFPQLEIERRIGAGGMGAVYRARQKDLDRWVALKVLPAGGTETDGFADRFNREARALARLSHPNIVAIHEFGQVPGYHFFLMEYVDGANLRELQRAGRISPREALQIVPQVCDALQYAHDAGIIHRDIKPENVLVDRRGRVKIADFGLARILDAGAGVVGERLTGEGQVMGTPHYMAPEQVERPQWVDHRADIYSLGVVFYELLTGELPLGKFPPPSRKAVRVDVRLDEIVLRALENDPDRRYQHASEVKSRVETVRDDPGLRPKAVEAPSGVLGVDDDDPGIPDWREWIPFQSGMVKAIYRHYTPEERREDLRLGMSVLVPFLVTTGIFVFGFFSLTRSGHRMWVPPLILLYGLAALANLGISAAESRRFLASTAWARRKGIRADMLNLFSSEPWEPVGGLSSNARSSTKAVSNVLLGFLLGTALVVFAGRPLFRIAQEWWRAGTTKVVPAEAVVTKEKPVGGMDEVIQTSFDPAAMEVPPVLQFLAWQREGRSVEVDDLYDVFGNVPTNQELRALVWKQVSGSRVDVRATEAGKRHPRFLQAWISHPLLDRWGQTLLQLRETNGQVRALGADATVSTSSGETGTGTNRLGWQVFTFCPGEGDAVPEVLDMRWEYVVGPLERITKVAPDFKGGMSVDGGGQLSGIGQDSEGRAFISFAMDAASGSQRRLSVQATLTDGREVMASETMTMGPLAGGVRTERFQFKVPLAQVREFRLGSRPVRGVEWPGVRLPPKYW